jgi:hypothetical protein
MKSVACKINEQHSILKASNDESRESFQALGINFDLKDYFNHWITIEIGTKYKNKNELHRD